MGKLQLFNGEHEIPYKGEIGKWAEPYVIDEIERYLLDEVPYDYKFYAEGYMTPEMENELKQIKVKTRGGVRRRQQTNHEYRSIWIDLPGSESILLALNHWIKRDPDDADSIEDMSGVKKHKLVDHDEIAEYLWNREEGGVATWENIYARKAGYEDREDMKRSEERMWEAQAEAFFRSLDDEDIPGNGGGDSHNGIEVLEAEEKSSRDIVNAAFGKAYYVLMKFPERDMLAEARDRADEIADQEGWDTTKDVKQGIPTNKDTHYTVAIWYYEKK